MTAGNGSIISEEIIFYIDLATEYINKETLVNEINSFIQEKSKISNLTTFGIVIFQEEDNPITSYDQNKSKSITDIIEKHWDSRPKDSSYLENGLFEILSYIFRKARKENKIYRIIVISDTPSRRSEEYHQAVYDLIIKSKNFSTIVDIVRVGDTEYHDDDIKLKVLSSETHGGTFYCQLKQFNDVIGSLIKNKHEFNIIQGFDGNQISEEDKTFYEHLAADLITLDPEDEEICSICQLELCHVCGAYSDEIHKCYNCNAKFHGCCASRYSIIKNIGFKHIFRCPQCQTLLKLDEDYVNLVYEEEKEDMGKLEKKQTVEQEVQVITNTLEIEGRKDNQSIPLEKISLDTKRLPTLPKPELKLIPKPTQPAVPPPAQPQTQTKKVRLGGYFGQDIEVESLEKTNDVKILEPKTMTRIIEPKKSITTLKPPKKRRSLKFCKICGTSCSNVINCPNCGAFID